MSRIDEIIQAASARTGVPISMIKSIIAKESGGKAGAVSPKGAKGLMQLMDSTGQEWFKKGRYSGTYNPFDEQQNINIGTDYLDNLMDKYKDPKLAWAAYNAGPGRVDRDIKRAGDAGYSAIEGYLPQETKQYVQSLSRQEGLGDKAGDILQSKAQDYAYDELSSLAGYGSAPASSAGSFPVATAVDGGTLMSDGTYAAMSSAPVEGAALSPFSIQGFGSAGNAYLPAIGALGAYDLFANNRQGARGVVQGVASGVAMGSYFGPPGMLIGGGIGLVAGIGQGIWGDKDRWQTEQKAINKLRDQGINVPESEADHLTKGRTKEELVGIEQAKINAGKYGNVDYARTRDAKFLKPEDTWGASDWYKEFGNDYLGSMSEEQRRQLNQAALDAGAVTDKYGKLNIDFGKIDQGLVKNIREGKGAAVKSNEPPKTDAAMVGDAATRMQSTMLYQPNNVGWSDQEVHKIQKKEAIKTDIAGILSKGKDNANDLMSQYANMQKQAGNLTSDEANKIGYTFPKLKKISAKSPFQMAI